MKKRFRTEYRHFVKDESGKWFEAVEVLEKTITDRMEPRDSWKKVAASNYFTAVVRERYGTPFCVHTRDIEEIGGRK